MAFAALVVANILFMLSDTRSHRWLDVIPPLSIIIVGSLASYVTRRYRDRRYASTTDV